MDDAFYGGPGTNSEAWRRQGTESFSAVTMLCFFSPEANKGRNKQTTKKKANIYSQPITT